MDTAPERAFIKRPAYPKPMQPTGRITAQPAAMAGTKGRAPKAAPADAIARALRAFAAVGRGT